MRIKSVLPSMALPSGIVRLEVEQKGRRPASAVEVGGVAAGILGASPRALTIRVPEDCDNGIVVHNSSTVAADLKVGRMLASELHPVGNPVVDGLDNVYVTYSGTRGEKVSFSVFVISADGTKEPFLAEITNPTGLAIGPDECLYVSSRHTGAVYRSTFDKQVEKYVDGLGLATGLAFDGQGNLFVGDRSGSIYKVAPDRKLSVFCELEPSVSAYHLAVAGDDSLYVTGPTLATQDCVYRVDPGGAPEVFFKGLGRPQGLAFDPQGNLQVAASYRGRKGLFTFRDGVPELTVSGPMLVGLAYNQKGNLLYLVDCAQLYQIELN